MNRLSAVGLVVGIMLVPACGGKSNGHGEYQSDVGKLCAENLSQQREGTRIARRLAPRLVVGDPSAFRELAAEVRRGARQERSTVRRFASLRPPGNLRRVHNETLGYWRRSVRLDEQAGRAIASAHTRAEAEAAVNAGVQHATVALRELAARLRRLGGKPCAAVGGH